MYSLARYLSFEITSTQFPTQLKKSDLLVPRKWLQSNYFRFAPFLPSLSHIVSITWHFASLLHSRKQRCFFNSADLLVTTQWQNHTIQISSTCGWGRLLAVVWIKISRDILLFLITLLILRGIPSLSFWLFPSPSSPSVFLVNWRVQHCGFCVWLVLLRKYIIFWFSYLTCRFD